MRLFVAIPLPAAVIEELAAIPAQLRPFAPALRWSAPESWHITLQFLGAAGQEQYQCAVSRLRQVQSRPISIRFRELGFFDRAGVFFAGVAVTPDLLSLHERVIAATVQCAFVPEDRPFHPHITLARAKGDAGRRDMERLQRRISRPPRFNPFLAGEFVLFESFLGDSGARYDVRERFPLASC